MSQRMAFLLSIAFALVFAVGIVAARDRLFPGSNAEGSVAVTSPPTSAVAKSLQSETTTKIVDIFEPTPTPAADTTSGFNWNSNAEEHDGHDSDHEDHENNHDNDHGEENDD